MVQQTTQRTPHVDKELEEFRSQMEVPSTYEEGFNWKSLLGALFIGFLMVPGAIYMGLITGTQNIGLAAQWVTVILFIEVARRAQASLKNAEIFVLFYMAGAAMGMPFSGLLWTQFFAHSSQAAQATGIAALLPTWVAPHADSISYAKRTFFHPDWFPALGLIAFQTFFGTLANMVLGYGLFRLTSDIEKLPFPMAPVSAQGIMALAEDAGEKASEDSEKNWRWRIFAIGGAIGLVFGGLYVLLPILTEAFNKGVPVTLFSIPFADTTSKTQNFLPAVATGLSWDITGLFTGMVMPFFAVLGGFLGLLATIIANPVMYHHNILTQWNPGDTTIPTVFKNNIDFYFSFGIGLMFAVALIGIYQLIRGIRERRAVQKDNPLDKGELDDLPKTRGDIKGRVIIACYFLVTITYIIVSMFLIGWERKNWGVLVILLLFGFLYTPLISYVTARLEGMAGQVVEIPFIKEASFILSGYQGVAIWFLPIPMSNYGAMTVFYRTCQLTGTKFTSIWKTQLILFPIILLASFFFMNFIWGLGEVPSAAYPFANKMWELQASNQSIIYTSTMGEYSVFQEAFKPGVLGVGFGLGIILFAGLNLLGAPIFLFYGIIRGLNQAMPHYIIPEMIGALIGRFYFQKKLGLKWRQYIPVVFAGFSCGSGLIAILGIGIKFLSKSVVQLPF